MSPRPYAMGKRAASVEATRQRILTAALHEYAETGIAEASMQSIARRADVAPGTVLYHFPEPDLLADTDVEYHAWTRSQGHPSMATVAQWYNNRYAALLQAALGDLATDPTTFAVVSALIEPGLRANLIQRGLSEQQTVTETVRLVLARLDESSAQTRSSSAASYHGRGRASLICSGASWRCLTSKQERALRRTPSDTAARCLIPPPADALSASTGPR